MKNEKKRNLFGFSVLDALLLILIAVCILSAVFQNQIRAFFSEEPVQTIEYTFVIENVTEKSRNRPQIGEELTDADNFSTLGVLQSAEEKDSVFVSESNPDDTVVITTLTCRAVAEAVETDAGWRVSGTFLRPGTSLVVTTPSASFEMTVTMIKLTEKSQ